MDLKQAMILPQVCGMCKIIGQIYTSGRHRGGYTIGVSIVSLLVCLCTGLFKQGGKLKGVNSNSKGAEWIYSNSTSKRCKLLGHRILADLSAGANLAGFTDYDCYI